MWCIQGILSALLVAYGSLRKQENRETRFSAAFRGFWTVFGACTGHSAAVRDVGAFKHHGIFLGKLTCVHLLRRMVRREDAASGRN